MPYYRIHRMRDHVRASFRNAPHTSGVAQVKPRDFLPLPEILETAEAIEAASPYAAWHEMLESERPLIIGDLLESVHDGNADKQAVPVQIRGFRSSPMGSARSEGTGGSSRRRARTGHRRAVVRLPRHGPLS